MRAYGLLFTGIVTCTSAFAATDPLLGTWVYNAQKSPKPTIRYGIKNLGGDRYALTGSTGVTVEVKADGASNQLPTSGTVAFRKLDDHDWEMVRNDGQNMVRTYTVSPDDKTLTLHDVFTGDPGNNYELTTRYARISAGSSIFGEWQSVSMEEKTTGERLKLTISPFDSGGLSFSSSAEKHRTEVKFDGKLYVDIGPGDPPGRTSSGKRVADRTLEIQHWVNGTSDGNDEFKVSEDGRTLTIVSRVPKSSAEFTAVWDKQ